MKYRAYIILLFVLPIYSQSIEFNQLIELPNREIKRVSCKNDTCFAIADSTDWIYLLMSTDNGDTWKKVYDEDWNFDTDAPHIPIPYRIRDGRFLGNGEIFLDFDKNTVWIDDDGKRHYFSEVYLSQNYFQSHDTISYSYGTIPALCLSNDSLFFHYPGSRKIYIYNNNRIDSIDNLPHFTSRNLYVNGNIIYMAGSSFTEWIEESNFHDLNDGWIDKIFRSYDFGKTWDSTKFIGTGRNRTMFFENDKIGWTLPWIETGNNDQKFELIYKTTNGGETWVEKYRNTKFTDVCREIKSKGNIVVAHCFWELIVSIDGGETWESFKLYDNNGTEVRREGVGAINSIDLSGDRIFVGTVGFGIFINDDLLSISETRGEELNYLVFGNEIMINDVNNAEYLIANINGKILDSGTLHGDNSRLDLTRFNSGLYIININNKGSLSTIKVVKE